METFKEVLAFPLLLSVVIFINGFPQSERTSMLSSLIFTWFACWLIGRVPAWASSGQKLRAWGLGAAAVLAGTWGSFFMLGPSPYELGAGAVFRATAAATGSRRKNGYG
jgi:thiol:disulfide interchange protein